jgi:hypothetical protein
MGKVNKFDGDIKCEVTAEVLKDLVKHWWWGNSDYENSKGVPRIVKLAMKEVKEKTGDSFNWSIGVWEKGKMKSERRILVISVNTQDFIDWKHKSKFALIPLDVPRRFKDGKDTYQCITDVCDLKSYTADKIIETVNAKNNPEYERIMESTKYGL